jgi:hypothetical protein
VVNLITFYAQEVREILASIGARSLDEVIGRADLLTQVSRGAAHLDDLDLNPMLITVDGADRIVYDRQAAQPVPDTLDAQIVKDAQPLPRGRREDAAELRGAEHLPHHRHADLQPHRAGASACAISCSPTT